MDKKRTLGGFFCSLIALIMGAGCSKHESEELSPKSGDISVVVNEHGFVPSQIALEKGKSSTLHFTRISDKTCATKVVFPDLKIEKDLPLGVAVAVNVATDEQREFHFQCGMGMYRSKVLVR